MESDPIVQGCRFEAETNLAGEVIARRCVFCGKVNAITTCPGCGKPIELDRVGKHYHGAACRSRAYYRRMKALRDAAKAREEAA